MYQFTERAGDLETLVLETFDSKLILPGNTPDVVRLFQNGDVMEIDLAKRTMTFDGVNPTRVVSSRLNYKRHVWIASGIVRPA